MDQILSRLYIGDLEDAHAWTHKGGAAIVTLTDQRIDKGTSPVLIHVDYLPIPDEACVPRPFLPVGLRPSQNISHASPRMRHFFSNKMTMCMLSLSLIVCALTLSGCSALNAIVENQRDHNAFLMKYRPADMMADPQSPLHLIRALANRFPTYYRAPVCDEHGCWVPMP